VARHVSTLKAGHTTVRMMDLQSFRQSVLGAEPPKGSNLALQALWWDAKGDWDKAHDCAQAREDAAGNHVHAYLHRKEGDRSNAAYWYRRAAAPFPEIGLDEEWRELVQTFLRE
jgi:hypothetical protein